MTLEILIADDEPAARFGMKRALQRFDCDLIEAADGEAALAEILTRRPHLAFVDLNMPALDGKSVLVKAKEAWPECEVVIVTANDSLDAAIECMRLGASDYLTKPYEVERLRAIARRSAERVVLRAEVANLRSRLDEENAFGALVGQSRVMRQLFAKIERAASAPLDVLIGGETGTGKELIAREIHARSLRASGPFVTVNASAITATLAESELFGHVKGAFTGAEAARKGVFEQAHTGTLFLDEVGDMAVELQAKLLRALQQREVQPVGGDRSVAVDVRVISASHQDLELAIAEDRFRSDLYYRIKGIFLAVPPLRARRGDIPLLADYFLDRLASKTGEAVPRLAEDAVVRLLAHPWPGNVRELAQVVSAAAAMVRGATVEAADLGLPTSGPAPGDLDLLSLAALPLTEAKNRVVEWFERGAIERALQENDGNVSAAARQLGIHRQSLQQKITHLGIERPGVER